VDVKSDVQAHGDMDGFHDQLSEDQRALDPAFVDAYRSMLAAASSRHALSDADRELIGLALTAAVTYLHLPGLQRHIQSALAAGATTTQIVEALEISSVLGIHTLTVAVPVIFEELQYDASEPLTEEQEALKSAFLMRPGGSWPEMWNLLVRVDAEFLTAYKDYSGAPWTHEEGLEPKIREFIYIAINASTTHLLVPGIRAHTRKALAHGATLEELLEVLKLTSLIGMRSFIEGSGALISAQR
jgi:alkylhydroperoxidase/carboxymuconolactone decarboxylase family protein YurZ